MDRGQPPSPSSQVSKTEPHAHACMSAHPIAPRPVLTESWPGLACPAWRVAAAGVASCEPAWEPGGKLRAQSPPPIHQDTTRLVTHQPPIGPWTPLRSPWLGLPRAGRSPCPVPVGMDGQGQRNSTRNPSKLHPHPIVLQRLPRTRCQLGKRPSESSRHASSLSSILSSIVSSIVSSIPSSIGGAALGPCQWPPQADRERQNATSASHRLPPASCLFKSSGVCGADGLSTPGLTPPQRPQTTPNRAGGNQGIDLGNCIASTLQAPAGPA